MENKELFNFHLIQLLVYGIIWNMVIENNRLRSPKWNHTRNSRQCYNMVLESVNRLTYGSTKKEWIIVTISISDFNVNIKPIDINFFCQCWKQRNKQIQWFIIVYCKKCAIFLYWLGDCCRNCYYRFGLRSLVGTYIMSTIHSFLDYHTYSCYSTLYFFGSKDEELV